MLLLIIVFLCTLLIKKFSVLKLADYDIILTNLALRTSLVIYHLIFDATRRIIVCD